MTNQKEQKEKLTTQPYKGARDFYPQEMRVRNYIFSVWKRVCNRFGFEEYDFPILEPLEIFAAKTGEEIVNQQLFSFEDRGGRKLAIRPELTPGTVRMLAQKFGELTPPVKWFMIGNNWRYEKPQLGRGREFYQLEANIFGIDEVEADFEIFTLILAIMQEFGANETMFELFVSDRRLIGALLQDTLKLSENQTLETRRLMDKRKKLEKEAFMAALADVGLNLSQAETVEKYMNCSLAELDQVISPKVLQTNKGYQNINKLFSLIKKAGFEKYVSFDPSIIRGFDYSDGLVYEVFDKNPANRRSMFGGERFDRLINIFGNYNMAATGFAMGDWTLLEFLKNWKLLPEFGTSETDYLVTVWPKSDNSEDNNGSDTKFYEASNEVAKALRAKNKNVTIWTGANTKLDKQLKYADKKSITYAIIIGEDELKAGQVTVKDLKSQKQETKSLEMFLAEIKSN